MERRGDQRTALYRHYLLRNLAKDATLMAPLEDWARQICDDAIPNAKEDVPRGRQPHTGWMRRGGGSWKAQSNGRLYKYHAQYQTYYIKRTGTPRLLAKRCRGLLGNELLSK